MYYNRREQGASIPGSLIDMEPGEPQEVVVPAKRETFECQVLVFTRPYTRLETPFGSDPGFRVPFAQVQRVIKRGRYRLDFVPSSLLGGKPTLILYEQDGDDQK